MWRSAIERQSISLKRSFDVSTVAALCDMARRLRWTARRARRMGTGFGGSGAPQPTVMKIGCASCGGARRRGTVVGRRGAPQAGGEEGGLRSRGGGGEPIGRRGGGELARRRVE